MLCNITYDQSYSWTWSAVDLKSHDRNIDSMKVGALSKYMVAVAAPSSPPVEFEKRVT